jgi:DNA-binding transcriptional MocR family regulator
MKDVRIVKNFIKLTVEKATCRKVLIDASKIISVCDNVDNTRRVTLSNNSLCDVKETIDEIEQLIQNAE